MAVAIGAAIFEVDVIANATERKLFFFCSLFHFVAGLKKTTFSLVKNTQF